MAFSFFENGERAYWGTPLLRGVESGATCQTIEEGRGTAVDTVKHQCQQILDALERTPLAKRSVFSGCLTLLKLEEVTVFKVRSARILCLERHLIGYEYGLPDQKLNRARVRVRHLRASYKAFADEVEPQGIWLTCRGSTIVESAAPPSKENYETL